MIKKTLAFSNPAYLSLKNRQLVIRMPEVEKANVSDSLKSDAVRTIPIEDIGVVVLENKQITITNALLEALLENNCAVVTCNSSMMPAGLLLPLYSHTVQSQRFTCQISASAPLKKQLWQQTIQCKITNQARVLSKATETDASVMLKWAERVQSGDVANMEARAAAFYWKNLFPNIKGFTREQDGDAPNNLLNYGYAILRAVIARSLVGSGMLPTFGIHHHNRYNAFCLADDIMEPYRPFVDQIVLEIFNSGVDCSTLTTDLKRKLLAIPAIDVTINGSKSPLMIAATTTTSSLFKCFNGESRKIIYPTITS
ncbi:MAG: type II CRISPR-associated endonuclease Cas1 [Bacteroidaceae bacterium]|nr:type II CRISPR-associated endonuclease Cas1 [Bacteroidaceae bacterium]